MEGTRLPGELRWCIFFTLLFVSSASSPYPLISNGSGVITHLPGFQGPLPFHLQTGYVEVDNSNGVRLFYYFIRSERSPADDPLMLWLTGGPGCSVLTGLAYEIAIVTNKLNGLFSKCLRGICPNHVLEPLCAFASPHALKLNLGVREMLQLQEYTADAELHLSEISLQCRVSSPIFTRSYSNNLTFATVKVRRPDESFQISNIHSRRKPFLFYYGGGHTAPEYMPRQCFAMFARWISDDPL
nr:unnamed protein product [Digitaria exilis]